MVEITFSSWNINSVRLRLPLIARFLRQEKPDILCLQETKCPDWEFPSAAFSSLGYRSFFRGQSGYHGVAILSRIACAPHEEELHFCSEGHCRYIGCRVLVGKGIDIHNFYVPAGGDEADCATNPKFAHKLDFIDRMTRWSDRLSPDARHIILGDFNIAPLEHDVWSHKQLLRVVSHTPIEIARIERLRAAHGWVDVIRHFTDEREKLYSWWSYRARDWALSDRGRRLDHIWASPCLETYCKKGWILRAARGWEKPSDHVPLLATFNVTN